MKWGFKMSKEKEEQTPEAVTEGSNRRNCGSR